jgi:hypothetical protein
MLHSHRTLLLLGFDREKQEESINAHTVELSTPIAKHLFQKMERSLVRTA